MSVTPSSTYRAILLAIGIVAQSAAAHSTGAFDNQIKNNSLAVSPNEAIAVVSYAPRTLRARTVRTLWARLMVEAKFAGGANWLFQVQWD